MKNDLIILLPAYNEASNVVQMVETWQNYRTNIATRYNLQLEIVVINDGSKDGTKEISEVLCKKYDNFTLLNHHVNKGLGEAVKTGIMYVIEKCHNSRYACIMDCDNTQDPKYVIDMLKKISQDSQTIDVIIASRYQNGSKVEGVSKYRLLTSNGAKYVYGAMLNVKNVKDYTCGYRLYTRNILLHCYTRFGSEIIEESGFTCMAELLYKLYCVGAKFAEIPFVLHYDLKQGQSKMKVFKTSISSIQLAFKLKRLKRLKI